MASPVPYPVVDDKDLDDAALWAVIDAAAAAASASSKSRKPLAIKYPNFHSPISKSNASPTLPKTTTTNPSYYNYTEPDSKVSADGEVLEEPWVFRPPRKIARTSSSQASDTTSPLVVFRNVQRTPEKYLSPEIRRFTTYECSPGSCGSGKTHEKETSASTHSLSAIFPSVSLFKEYQNTAMAILEKTDYTMISGNPFIKKSGWRKISFYFNLSFEIRDKTIEFDENRNVQRAEFVVRASMQGGRFSDGWGSCERREKRFLKPNHDIPSTAETRAKNKACQDLLGIGEYRPGAGQVNR
ncbi:peptide transporter family protein [Parasponia andersonii]|uniref:Peptide transporter family protein n=1 Tax=Parasponia andersonii TaxID=3476 RepID=A0A2P5APS0_PARAD|nr:peptide transporter family protein [Parasponia andersonii]